MLEVHIPSVGPEAEESGQSPEKGHMVFRVEVLCRGRRHTVPRRYSEFHALHKRIKKLYKVPDFPSKRLPNWRTRGLEQRRQGLEAYIQGVLYLNQDVPKELLEFLRLRHLPTDPKANSWGTLEDFLPSNSRQVTVPSSAGSCCHLVARCQEWACHLWPLACPCGPSFPTGAPKPTSHSPFPLWVPGELISGVTPHGTSPYPPPRWFTILFPLSCQLYRRPVVSFCMDPYICTPSPEPLPNVVVNGVLQGLYSFSINPIKAQPEAACHLVPPPPAL
ncbi:sorting nexin-22 isoform X1 [Loxodonta africana]|uniref:sorting nexin-22 isoform X1 n=1 Tax=Loxodonta africana TaxID=9785 RepID=UPI0030CEFF55